MARFIHEVSMRIGELSRSTGVSISTIRLYEREGLITPASRTDGKFREFTPEQERRLKFIKRIRNLGFSLHGVKALLELSDASPILDAQGAIERIRSSVATRTSDLAVLDRRLGKALVGESPTQGLEDAFSSSN